MGAKPSKRALQVGRHLYWANAKTNILGKCKDQPSLPLVTSGTIEDKERIFTDLFTGRF